MRIEAKVELERERRWAKMRIDSKRRRPTAGDPAVQQAQPPPSEWWEEAELDLALPWVATG